MLDDYEHLYGLKAVTRLASYISVSEFGLTETELLELLMPTTGDFGAPLNLEDGNFNFSTFCTAKKTISKNKNIIHTSILYIHNFVYYIYCTRLKRH